MSFESAISEVLLAEGGYVDHPDDRGGPTNYGITQKTLSDFLGREATKEEVRSMTIDTVRQIYKSNYWDRLKLSFVIDSRLSNVIFDQAVNRGTRRVAEQIQKIVGVKQDGIIGPLTLKAINNMDSKKMLLNFIKQSQDAYVSIVTHNPSQLVFLSGWIKRTHKFLDYV
jgi:lysozyme family protein